MELSELITYAKEKYGIEEQHKWADFPGFSVLCHPRTGKWAALLMRQWDGESGMMAERCDLKCGSECLRTLHKSYLSAPVRMHGQRWIGISFSAETEKEIVFRLFDRAISDGDQRGYTIVLNDRQISNEKTYGDTPLPFAQSTYRPQRGMIPAKIREMRRLYERGKESLEARARNFYRQAVFMQDYEDDLPWTGIFTRYFPTYHDLNTEQLRGYFTWRTHVRKGEYSAISASAVYIYLYELLNGIGVSSPAESLQKLKEFEKGYLDAGFGDIRMRQNLYRWMMDFVLIHDLPETLREEYADPLLKETDKAICVLKKPEAYSDQEVFAALCKFAGKSLKNTPVMQDPVRGSHLFAEVWRRVLKEYRRDDMDIFRLCFGERTVRRWYPLSNAVYYTEKKQPDRDVVLNDCRVYTCKDGSWTVSSYEKIYFDLRLLQGLVHETDLMLRRYLKTGHYLKEKTEDTWAVPYITAVIEEERRALAEAARPRITIDLSGLEQIRQDAEITRDSLLTDEEKAELYEEEKVSEPAETGAEMPLDALQVQILQRLLNGEDVTQLLRDNHLMPTITADLINEIMFDEIGDNILECENDRLSLVEDYEEDIAEMLGGQRR